MAVLGIILVLGLFFLCVAGILAVLQSLVAETPRRQPPPLPVPSHVHGYPLLDFTASYSVDGRLLNVAARYDHDVSIPPTTYHQPVGYGDGGSYRATPQVPGWYPPSALPPSNGPGYGQQPGGYGEAPGYGGYNPGPPGPTGPTGLTSYNALPAAAPVQVNIHNYGSAPADWGPRVPKGCPTSPSSPTPRAAIAAPVAPPVVSQPAPSKKKNSRPAPPPKAAVAVAPPAPEVVRHRYEADGNLDRGSLVELRNEQPTRNLQAIMAEDRRVILDMTSEPDEFADFRDAGGSVNYDERIGLDRSYGVELRRNPPQSR